MIRKKSENKQLLLDITDLTGILTAKEEISTWIWKILFNNIKKEHTERNKKLKITLEYGDGIFKGCFDREKYPEEVYNLKD